MAILDDVIGVFSLGWKAARLRSRAVIQAYEAVKTTRTHKARRENRTADQLSQYGAVSLREQARYLDNNHDLVIGVFDKLEERVVGKNGIIVEPHPVLRNGATRVTRIFIFMTRLVSGVLQRSSLSVI